MIYIKGVQAVGFLFLFNPQKNKIDINVTIRNQNK